MSGDKNGSGSPESLIGSQDDIHLESFSRSRDSIPLNHERLSHEKSPASGFIKKSPSGSIKRSIHGSQESVHQSLGGIRFEEAPTPKKQSLRIEEATSPKKQSLPQEASFPKKSALRQSHESLGVVQEASSPKKSALRKSHESFQRGGSLESIELHSLPKKASLRGSQERVSFVQKDEVIGGTSLDEDLPPPVNEDKRKMYDQRSVGGASFVTANESFGSSKSNEPVDSEILPHVADNTFLQDWDDNSGLRYHNWSKATMKYIIDRKRSTRVTLTNQGQREVSIHRGEQVVLNDDI